MKPVKYTLAAEKRFIGKLGTFSDLGNAGGAINCLIGYIEALKSPSNPKSWTPTQREELIECATARLELLKAEPPPFRDKEEKRGNTVNLATYNKNKKQKKEETL